MTTRTLFTVKLIKQPKEVADQAGATTLWLTADERFELRGDDIIEFGAGRHEIEWGVWDRTARNGEGDWADGGRGNGVATMNEGAKLIRDVLAAEAQEAAKARNFRPAALASIGTVAEHQTKVTTKISQILRLASNCVDPTDDSLKMGSLTSAKVLVEELLAEFADLGRANLIRSIESKGLHIPDNAR